MSDSDRPKYHDIERLEEDIAGMSEKLDQLGAQLAIDAFAVWCKSQGVKATGEITRTKLAGVSGSRLFVRGRLLTGGHSTTRPGNRGLLRC